MDVTNRTFIEKSKHNNTFDYSLVNYENIRTKVKIQEIDKIHMKI